MSTKVDFFTKGKTGRKNEDYYGYNNNSFVVADGATDKSGRIYDGKTGGEIASHLVVEKCLATDLNGPEIVNYLNQEINKLYLKLGIIDDIKNAVNRFTCAFVLARCIEEKVIITFLGDSGFRINGTDLYKFDKKLDIDHAQMRADYINETGDVEGSYDHIKPFIIKQYRFQNHPSHELGYGALDGTDTPNKFIEVFEYDRNKVKTIELFTDGYYDFPEKPTVEEWEKVHKIVQKEDPDKYLKYKSVNSEDDRTVLVVNFE